MFYEKIGDVPEFDEIDRMFWGTELEDAIVDKWQYWDGTPDGYIANFRNGNIIRKRRRIHGVILNDDYPWLFANTDALMNKGGYSMSTGERLTDGGIIEAKNTTKYFLDSYQSEVPEPWILQVHVYMIVTGLRYAEVAMLLDNKEYRVCPVDYDQGIADGILNITKSFWYDRVLPAREYVELKNKYPSKEDYYRAKIIDLEPEPENKEDYMALMSDKFEEREFDDENKLMGNQEDVIRVNRLAILKRIAKVINEMTGEEKAYFANRFNKMENRIIHFENGKIHFKRTKGRRSPVESIKEDYSFLDGSLKAMLGDVENYLRGIA